MIFDPAGQGQADPVDLRGGARAPRRFIGWQTFFDFGPTFTDGPGNPNPAIRPNKLIDTHDLHPAVPSAGRSDRSGRPRIRSHCRSGTCSVTSPGHSRLARASPGKSNVPVLSKRDLSDLKHFGLGLDESTPLWFYALKEGQRHGKVACVWGRLVAASWGKSSSGCCNSTSVPIWRPIRGGNRRCRTGVVKSPATSRWSTFSPLPAWIPSAAVSKSGGIDGHSPSRFRGPRRWRGPQRNQGMSLVGFTPPAARPPPAHTGAVW